MTSYCIFGEVVVTMYLMITFKILGLFLAKPADTAAATLGFLVKGKFPLLGCFNFPLVQEKFYSFTRL